MDKSFEKESFETLKIKRPVAKKFRRFCRNLGESQSMALMLMVDFFEEHGLSPRESMGPKMQTLENLIKKRFNAIIAIVRDIEKNQTKPTVAMIQALFESYETEKKPLLLEKDSKTVTGKKLRHVENNPNET